MNSLSEHLTCIGSCTALRYRGDCPRCRAERISGALPCPQSALSQRSRALLLAAALGAAGGPAAVGVLDPPVAHSQLGDEEANPDDDDAGDGPSEEDFTTPEDGNPDDAPPITEPDSPEADPEGEVPGPDEPVVPPLPVPGGAFPPGVPPPVEEAPPPAAPPPVKEAPPPAVPPPVEPPAPESAPPLTVPPVDDAAPPASPPSVESPPSRTVPPDTPPTERATPETRDRGFVPPGPRGESRGLIEPGATQPDGPSESVPEQVVPDPALLDPVVPSNGQTGPDDSAAAPARSSRGAVHAVAPGESLWSIAQARLGYNADPSRVARLVNEIWTLNAERIGTGRPELIFPGQRLVLPPR